MNRLCVLVLLIGCDAASEPPVEVAVAPAPHVVATPTPTPAPALPPTTTEPVIRDLSNDVIAPTPAPALPPPADSIVIDLSNDVIVVEATCGDRSHHDDDDEPDDPPLPPCAMQLHDSSVTITHVYDGEDEPDVLLDVQDRCPDQPEDTGGDIDGCPDPEPQPPVE